MSELSNIAQERFNDNKRAFEDVIGDPFSQPEALTGYYTRMRSRSDIRVANNNFDEGHPTGNAARPSPVDFFCDVEKAIAEAIAEVSGRKNTLHNFIATYITESSETLFTAKQRQTLEQHIGKTFLERGISPVSSYFKTIRQSIGTTKRGKQVQHANRIARTRLSRRTSTSL